MHYRILGGVPFCSVLPTFAVMNYILHLAYGEVEQNRHGRRVLDVELDAPPPHQAPLRGGVTGKMGNGNMTDLSVLTLA
jgi:hypothetical protein